MNRVMRVVVFVLSTSAWIAGFGISTASAATSSGCAALQAAPTADISFVVTFNDTYNAGETIGAVLPGGSFGNGTGRLTVNSVVVATVPSSGGTLSYVIPSTGVYNVQFQPDSGDSDAIFDYFCNAPIVPPGPCDGGAIPKGYKVIKGTNFDDHLYAGSGNTIMFGYAGNDWLWGGSGDDIICGGPGNDHISGGSGKDFVSGGDGNDWIIGDSGDDTLHGDGGNDKIAGATGNDLLVGGPGTDVMDGGVGTDTGVDPDPDSKFFSIEHQQQEEQPPPPPPG